MTYNDKYLKYKSKYLILKSLNQRTNYEWDNLSGGSNLITDIRSTFFSVVFSPDNKYIGFSYGNSVKIASIDTGMVIQTLNGHTDRVCSVAFSPDGKLVVSGSYDKSVKIWSLETGKVIHTLIGHISSITSVAFSPIDNYIASGSNDTSIKLWSTFTGNVVRTLNGHKYAVTSIAFSPDGKFLVSGSGDGSIKIWSTETLDVITLNRDTSYISSVSFSSDGQFVVSGSDDKSVKIWSTKTHNVIRTLDGHTAYISSVAFSYDGKYVVSGSYDKTVKIWSIETGNVIQTLDHTSNIYSVRFSSDNDRTYIVSGSDNIKIWYKDISYILKEYKSQQHPLQPQLPQPLQPRQSQQLQQSQPHLQSPQPQQPLQPQLQLELYRTLQESDYIYSVAFSSDNKYIVSSNINSVKILSIETGTIIRTLDGHTDTVRSVAFSPDGKFVISGSDDQSVKIWSTATGINVKTLNGHTAGITSVAFSSDGLFIVSGSLDNRVKYWSTETGNVRYTFITYIGPSSVRSVAFNSSGKFVVSGSDNDDVTIWSTETGKVVRILNEHTKNVNSVAFSPDEKFVVSGSSDNTVRIWLTETGKNIFILNGHTDFVRSVAFSPNGKYVISGSYDKTVKIWSTDTGDNVHTLYHTKTIYSVAFSSNGEYIVSGSDNIKIWSVNYNIQSPILPLNDRRINFVVLNGISYNINIAYYEDTSKIIVTALSKSIRMTIDILTKTAYIDSFFIGLGAEDHTLNPKDIMLILNIIAFYYQSKYITLYDASGIKSKDSIPKPPLCNKHFVSPYISYYGRYGFIKIDNILSNPSITLEDVIKNGNKKIEKNKFASQQEINTNVETIVKGYYNYTKGPYELPECDGKRIRNFDQINQRWVIFNGNQYDIENFNWKVNVDNITGTFSITK